MDFHLTKEQLSAPGSVLHLRTELPANASKVEIKNKEFYFIIAAAEESVPMMERTIDGFRGFLDCLEEPKECGTIYGVGAWKVGEINDKPSMHEAYEMGKKV